MFVFYRIVDSLRREEEGSCAPQFGGWDRLVEGFQVGQVAVVLNARERVNAVGCQIEAVWPLAFAAAVR